MCVTGRSNKRSSRSNSINPDAYITQMWHRSEAAKRNMERYGFTVEVTNGQRISTNTQLDPEPILQSRWNEIFIGKLPRDVFEDELLPHLSVPAPVYNIRYMLHFSNTNRGYCYVKYANTYDAALAIRYLDGRTIIPNRLPIGAKISFDNRKLRFENLPLDCTEKRLKSALSQAEIEDILSVCILRPATSQSRSVVNFSGQPMAFPAQHQLPAPGLNPEPSNEPSLSALVTFSTHDAATRARRLLLPGEVQLFGRQIKMDWIRSEVPSYVQQILDRFMLIKQPVAPAGHYTQNNLLPLAPQERTANESGETSIHTESSSSCTSPSSTADFNNNTTMLVDEINYSPHQDSYNHNQCTAHVNNISWNILNQNGAVNLPASINDLNMSIVAQNCKAMLDLDFIHGTKQFSNLSLNGFD